MTEKSRIRFFAVAAVLWVGGLLAVGPLTGGLAFSPVVQTVVALTPGAVATTIIELLGKSAIPLIVVGVAGAVVAGAAGLGAVWSRLPDRTPAPIALGVGGLLATTAVLLAGAGASPWSELLLGTVLATAPPVAFALFQPETAVAAGRRPFLQQVAAGGAVAVGAAAASRVPEVVASEDPGDELSAGQAITEKRTTGRTIAASTATASSTEEGAVATAATATGTTTGTTGTTGTPSPAEQLGFDFNAMPAKITDVDDHYVVDKNASNPRVEADDWTLDVGDGISREQFSVSLQDLLDHDDAVTQPVTMVCISNRVGGYLISTARWRGIPLKTLVDRADPYDSVDDVVTRSVDGYHEGIPIDVVRERDDILVAFAANGETLTAAHGYPARLLVPGRYGMKSTKWLSSIEFSRGNHESFWESRGWVDEARVNTLSYVRASTSIGNTVAVGGIAYAGTRGIQTVEVSTDGGDTWYEAEIEDAAGEYAWNRWRYLFETDSVEPFEAVVRATDDTGELQTERKSHPHPGGSTGWHHLDVNP